jgi:hypothetical protein
LPSYDDNTVLLLLGVVRPHVSLVIVVSPLDPPARYVAR